MLEFSGKTLEQLLKRVTRYEKNLSWKETLKANILREEIIKAEQKKREDIYRREFEEIKPTILKRDNHCCTVCGSEKNLEIHHKEYKSNGGGNTFENLTTLCINCHYETHRDEQAGNLLLGKIHKVS